jgi:hypothetical protein
MIPMPRRGKSEGDCTMSGWKFPQYATITFAAMLLLAGCQQFPASRVFGSFETRLAVHSSF